MSSRGGARLLIWVASLLVGCDESGADAGAGTGGGAIAGEPPDAGLAPWACEAGELALEDGSCLPAGIPPDECGTGFTPTADRSCEPVLPSAPCSDGEMALPGERNCRPLAPCPAGTWGDIPVESSTEYVDGSYTGGGSNGSATQPWTSVQTAIDNAEDGAIIAVAAGTYTQPLLVQNKRVRLWGVCPSLARIKTSGAGALRIDAGADGSEVHDLAFEATDGVAVNVGFAVDVLFDRIWVQRSDLLGVDIEGGNPGATVARSLIEDQPLIGVFGYGAEVVVEDTEIREVTQSSSLSFGYPIRVFADGLPTDLTVRRTVLSNGFGSGIYVNQSNAVVEDTVVTDIEPQGDDPDDGFGIRVLSDPEGPQSSLDLSGSYIARVHSGGVYMRASGNVRTTVVRDVTPSPDVPAGFGIVSVIPEGGVTPSAGVRSVVVERITGVGMAAVGAFAEVEATIFRDNEPILRGLEPGLPLIAGHGIEVAARPDSPVAALTLNGCRLERLHEVGITASGAALTVQGTLVSDVSARETDGTLGRGISVQLVPTMGIPASAVIRDSLIERVHEAGIFVFNADATIESTWIRDTQPSGPYMTQSGSYYMGRGIAVQGHALIDVPATATIDHVLVEGSPDAGVFVAGGEVTVRRSIVRTTVGIDEGIYGDGILAFAMPTDLYHIQATDWIPSTLDVQDCIVEDNVRAGISNFWSNVTVSGTWLSCNAIDLNGEQLGTHAFAFDDLGGNVCRCSADVYSCKVTSSGLQAPAALGE